MALFSLSTVCKEVRISDSKGSAADLMQAGRRTANFLNLRGLCWAGVTVVESLAWI